MFRKRRWLIIGGLILAQVGVIACYQGFLHGSSQVPAVGCCANEQPQAAAPPYPPTAAPSAPVTSVDSKTEIKPASLLVSEPPAAVKVPLATLPVAGPVPVSPPIQLPEVSPSPTEPEPGVAVNPPPASIPPVGSSEPVPVAPPPVGVAGTEPPLDVVIPPQPLPEPMPQPAAAQAPEWRNPVEVTAPPVDPPVPVAPVPQIPSKMQVPLPPPAPAPDVVVHPVVPAPVGGQPPGVTPLPPVPPLSAMAADDVPVPTPLPQAPPTETPPPPPVAPKAEAPLPSGPCPWTLKMTVIDGLTVMEARIDKEIQFRIVCEKLDLASPRGSINAQGDVKISGSGLDGHCQKLLINWHDDHILVEGDAYLKCHREGHDVELNADRLSLRLSQSSTIKGLGKVKETPVEEVSEPHESRAEPVKAPAKPPTPIRAE